MKKIIGILLCGMLLLCCGCQNDQDRQEQNSSTNQQEQLFEISSQLISILWDCLLYTSLDGAMLMAAKNVMSFVLYHDLPMHPLTLDAYNDMLRRIER